MKLIRIIVLLFVVAFALGAAATWLWWERVDPDLPGTPGTLVLLIGFVCILTCANIVIRWIKWRFVCRRNGIRVPAKKGLLIFLATLPAMLTPFYVGELMRLPLLGLPRREGLQKLVRVFALERGADAVVLAILILSDHIALSVLAIGLVCIIPLFFPAARKNGWSGAVLLGLPAWLLPVLALNTLTDFLHGGVGVQDLAAAFGRGTLFGGLSGIPVGAGITGSSILNNLIELGVTHQNALWIVSGFRLGTTWFALGIGSVALLSVLVLRSRKPVSEVHFDNIADQYEEEIPGHIRDFLLDRKVGAITAELGDVAVRSGLDVGCGQGQYSMRFSRLGAKMTGIDLSAGQLERARDNAQSENLSIEWKQASAESLPFSAPSFDFVYCVNMVHHLPDPSAQQKALQEMGRVLKPGGKMFMHEMNPYNPLFKFYMSYVFPVLNAIDEGTEWWVDAEALPEIEGGVWLDRTGYFTFLPDFTPNVLWKLLRPFENMLEHSAFKKYSAHYMAVWEKQ